MAQWCIQDQQSGQAALYQGRKSHGLFPDAKAAQRRAESLMADGDSLVHQELDGYRTTLKGRRKGWRAGQ